MGQRFHIGLIKLRNYNEIRQAEIEKLSSRSKKNHPKKYQKILEH